MYWVVTKKIPSRLVILFLKQVRKNGGVKSKQLGQRETNEILITGRIVLDVYDVVRRDLKYPSYTLNYVSKKLLNDQKEGLSHRIMEMMQNKSSKTRMKIAIYCLKDAELAISLMECLMIIVNSAELARASGIPHDYVYTRGQGIRTQSNILRKCLGHMLVPVFPMRWDDENDFFDYNIEVEESEDATTSFQGANVFNPISGFYDKPIITLDFASLYPSIMIANNLCYSTLVRLCDFGRKLPNGQILTKDMCYEGITG